MAVDTSGWPTKDEARYELGGLSLSQLNNLIKAKRLEVRLRKRPNQPPIGVINPTDLAREKEIRSQVRSHVIPKGAGDAQELPTANRAEFADALGAAIAAAIGENVQRALPPAPEGTLNAAPVPLADKPRVTIREAVALGYQASDLIARVKAGTLENVGTPHRYRFRRRDLDAL